MALWWFALLPAALLALALFAPLRARLRGSAALPEGGMLLLEVSALFGLIHYRFRFALNALRRPTLSILWHKDTGEVRVIWDLSHWLMPRNTTGKKSNFLLHAALKHLRLTRFDIGGSLGIEGDPFATAMLAGIFGEALHLFFLRVFNEKQQGMVRVAILPDFEGNALRLNLEGIGAVPPVQIIGAILLHLRGKAKTKRKEETHYVPSH